MKYDKSIMFRPLASLAVLCLFLCSCATEKKILKGNVLFVEDDLPRGTTDTDVTVVQGQSDSSPTTGRVPPPLEPRMKVYKVTEEFKAKVKEKEGYLTVSITKEELKKVADTVETIQLEARQQLWRADILGNVYFTEHTLKNADVKNNSDVEPDKLYKPENFPSRFTYSDMKLVLQGMSVPLKIRPELDMDEFENPFPSQAETGFTVAVAGGVKFARNVWRPDLNAFGKNTTTYSVTPGLFIGTGATDLKTTNTYPTIQIERKAALFTTGAFVAFGYNNVNVGYAIGMDRATGDGGKDWVYNGKFWHGLVIGFDIIK